MNREKQLDILRFLEARFPNIVDPSDLEAELGGADLDREMFYLRGHGLIDFSSKMLLSGDHLIGAPSITSQGLDFLEDDGGLSATLNTVTVRLHDDTIRQLLIDRVEKSDEPQTVKESLVAAIRKAPAQALSQVSTQAVQAGIQSLPDVTDTLRKLLGL